jgi:hypothetical protein
MEKEVISKISADMKQKSLRIAPEKGKSVETSQPIPVSETVPAEGLPPVTGTSSSSSAYKGSKVDEISKRMARRRSPPAVAPDKKNGQITPHNRSRAPSPTTSRVLVQPSVEIMAAPPSIPPADVVASKRPKNRGRNVLSSLATAGNVQSTHLKKFNATFNRIELDDPVQCGFLRVFCESEYSAENLSFLMEVDRFRDHMLADPSSWCSTWQDIDVDISISAIKDDDFSFPPVFGGSDEPEWPSRIVDRRTAEQMILSIWDRFLSDTSPTEVCVSPHILANTKRRISHLDLYGPEVFREALVEPLKTIQRDTLPRFFKSKLYDKMKMFLAASRPLPTADSLRVPAPSYGLLSVLTAEDLAQKEFDLNEILLDGLLYDEFLKYLRAKFCSENLLCVRMILLFEENVRIKDFITAEQQAWDICNYFVVSGSAYEVGLSHRRRKEVLLSLARPNALLFAPLKRFIMKELRTSFELFKRTHEYASLNYLMIQAKERMNQPKLELPCLTLFRTSSNSI